MGGQDWRHGNRRGSGGSRSSTRVPRAGCQFGPNDQGSIHGCPHIGGTVDTGHTRAYRAEAGLADSDLGTPRAAQVYNDLLMRKVEGLGPKLIHFHFDAARASDYREHRTLGKGIVDWPRLMSYLRRQSYRGSFALELEESPVVDAMIESREFYAKLIV